MSAAVVGHSTASSVSECVRIGTSGYSFDDWVGAFYPRGLRKTDRLAFYSRHFDTVEINATYYRIPSRSSFERMAEKTPSSFSFVVKGPRSMTHDRDPRASDWGTFLSAVQPLVEAGKFDGVLLQFPYAFRHETSSLEHLRRVRDHLRSCDVFVEFRHASWDRPETFEFLETHRMNYCAVDEPALPGLMPPVVRKTGNTGYIRFHGRNRKNWWGDGGGDRYDYAYVKDELDEWIGKIRSLAAETNRTYVFFNNCHAGQAVRGARLLADLLEIDLGGPQQGELL